VKWVLIGASNIAATRLVLAIRARGDEIVAVVSGSMERALDFAAQHDIRRATTDLTDTIRAGAEAAYVSSANHLHYGQVTAAIHAGLHVLCEKPMTLRLDESEHLAALAATNRRVLAVNHHLPGSDLHAEARELVDGGEIGAVLSARIAHATLLRVDGRTWRLRGQRGGGIILDRTTHDASVLNRLLGTPVRVSAMQVAQATWNQDGGPDAAMVTIEYRDLDDRPILAQTHDAFTVTADPTRLTLHGTRGTIDVIDAMSQEPRGTIELLTAAGRRELRPPQRDPYGIVLDAFAAATTGDGQPTVTAYEGIAALRVALAAEESATSGRVVELAR